MGVAELKKELHEDIEHADEIFLKMVHAMSQEYKASQTVGYTNNGKPITRKDLAQRVTSASQRVKSGHFISQEEIEKEIENW